MARSFLQTSVQAALLGGRATPMIGGKALRLIGLSPIGQLHIGPDPSRDERDDQQPDDGETHRPVVSSFTRPQADYDAHEHSENAGNQPNSQSAEAKRNRPGNRDKTPRQQ